MVVGILKILIGRAVERKILDGEGRKFVIFHHHVAYNYISSLAHPDHLIPKN